MMKLFCLPYAGASANCYEKWRQAFDKKIELVPVELAGRGRRIAEPLYGSFEECMEDLAKAIGQQTDGSPYAVYGHSMGAKLAFELYYHMVEKTGQTPVHLFFSGSNPPEIGSPEILYDLSDDKLKEAIIKLGGMQQEIVENAELFDYFLPTIRSDFYIDETYQYRIKQERLQCNISVLNGKRDDSIALEKMRLWENHTSGYCKYFLYEGDHFFIHEFQAPILQVIHSELQDYIEE